jgi:hypothetical protein
MYSTTINYKNTQIYELESTVAKKVKVPLTDPQAQKEG